MAIGTPTSATAGSSTGNPSITHGLTVNSGDVVVVSIQTNGTVTVTDNNGADAFTKDHEAQAGPGGHTHSHFSTVADGSFPATLNFTVSPASRWSLIMEVYTGVDASIWDVAPGASGEGDGSGTTATAPTITTLTDGAKAIVRYGWDTSSSTTTSGITNGFGDKVEIASPQGQAGYSKTIATAGAVGATAVTLSTSRSWYAQSMALKPAAGGVLTLDSVPTDVNSQTQESSQVSTPATTPTTGNTEVKWDNDSGAAATVDSITGTDPYTINFTFPRTAAKLFNSTGYPLYHEVDAENVTSAGNVPYLPISGQDFIDLSSPVDTAGTLGETYAGSATATGDQWVHDTALTGDATVTMDVDAQGFWSLDKTPSTTSTADFYRIDSTGTVDVEDTITFNYSTPTLSSPTGTKTGGTTASGTVTTDEGTGTLYYYASINSSEVSSVIKTSGSSQSVTASGVQNVSLTGLASSTTYYLHYVHVNEATNESNVVSSASFTTDASSVPPDSRVSINKIADALRDAGTYTHSQTNDLVVEWLVSEGISRTALNQMLYGYLGGLGYTGTLQDRMIAWSKDS